MAWLLYFYGLSSVGLALPDEPRYASVAHEMARSGDWITPRLWGQPWFEKPPLLYWMTAAGFRLGLGPELAARLPVAALAVAFLLFYWSVLRREFGERPAAFAALILGTSVLWVGYSEAAVTDLPMAATYSAGMLLALSWIARRETRWLPAIGVLLGLAVLAKGLVPLVLALPLVWWARRRFSDWLHPRVWAPFVAVAVPWYLLCWLRNGTPFLEDFFVRQHFSRFASGALMHTQPPWYYLPVFAAALLPWLPLAPLAVRRRLYDDPRRRFLLALVVFGLLFFSAALNKLPGYVLPLLPAAAALLGLALDDAAAGFARCWLAVCAVLLGIFPLAAQVLPEALASGISRAPRPTFHWFWLLPLGPAAAAWLLESRRRRVAALLCIAAGAAVGTGWVKYADAPAVDRIASARGLWAQLAARADQVCVGEIQRGMRYSLGYYAGAPLPDCAEAAKPLRVVQPPGEPPKIVRTADDTPAPITPVGGRLTRTRPAL